MHPQNRLWNVLGEVYGEHFSLPNKATDITAAISERRDFLLRHNIAMWDVLASCEIEGAADSSIKNAVPNDFTSILENSKIHSVFCTGKTAYNLWMKHCDSRYKKQFNLTVHCLPSTSPANAQWNKEKLIEEYKLIEETNSPLKHSIAHYHLPGLFEFYELYRLFLPLFGKHREYFYDWCDIASIYGAPADCLWSGGRCGFGYADAQKVFNLMNEYDISARLTFSNSLLNEEHLKDKKCNELCALFSKSKNPGGIILHSDLLADYIKNTYLTLYLVSSTTKVLTDFDDFRAELNRKDFKYVIPDFRLNKSFDSLATLSQKEKDKVEFLCNECCDINCKNRKACYENVSYKNLGNKVPDHKCTAPGSTEGYRFSKAKKNPSFIGIQDIKNIYLPMGFSNFKLEGRGLGSALVLEFLLYYMTKPEYQLEVREAVYLDSMLDLF